ncbi:hypothetical protein ACJW30_10G044800 [Castanea mollissima]
MCGSISIVFAKVLLNFLLKFFSPLVSTMHDIHANVNHVEMRRLSSSTLKLSPRFVPLEVTISTSSKDS